MMVLVDSDTELKLLPGASSKAPPYPSWAPCCRCSSWGCRRGSWCSRSRTAGSSCWARWSGWPSCPRSAHDMAQHGTTQSPGGYLYLVVCVERVVLEVAGPDDVLLGVARHEGGVRGAVQRPLNTDTELSCRYPDISFPKMALTILHWLSSTEGEVSQSQTY